MSTLPSGPSLLCATPSSAPDVHQTAVVRLLLAHTPTDVAGEVAYTVRPNWPSYHIDVATSGEEARQTFLTSSADLVIADTPTNSAAFDLCRRIREVSQVPILVFTADDSPIDRVGALELGADDCLSRPFDHLELVARPRAVDQRAGALAAGEDRFRQGGTDISFEMRECGRTSRSFASRQRRFSCSPLCSCTFSSPRPERRGGILGRAAGGLPFSGRAANGSPGRAWPCRAPLGRCRYRARDPGVDASRCPGDPLQR